MSLPSFTSGLSRREFFGKLTGGTTGKALAAAIPLAVLKSAQAQTTPATSSDPTDEIIWMSATKLAQQIREKKVSATEAVKAFIDRQEKVNRRMNAVVMMCYDRALAEAKAADEALARGESLGALHGVPITIKDSLDTEGVISTGGTIGREEFVPSKDATVVARVRKAGAILLGKTNTPEFTLGGLGGLSTTSNLVYGSSRNPYDLSRSTSGSSGGAGANIAAGGAAFDIGSDWGGSIRGPAHNQGIVGIKPTSVRVPRTGHIVGYGGVFDLWQQLGPLARRVEDAALITPIIAGPDFQDASCAPVPWANPASVDLKKLKVAYFADNRHADTDADTRAAITTAAKWLDGSVADITEDLPTDILTELYEARSKLTSGDAWAFYSRLAEKNHTKAFSPQVHDRMAKMVPISTADYVEAWFTQDTNKARMLEWFSKYDVLLCPVAGKPAQPIDMGYDPSTVAGLSGQWSYTGCFNTTGWPVVVVRVGSSADGKLPIGIQVVANPWREDICIAVASALEMKSGGWKRPPI